MNKSVIVALLEQNGTIEYINFNYNVDISLKDVEKIIKIKGNNFQVIDQGCLESKDFIICGYLTGNTFNKHEINNYNVKGDALMITLKDDQYANVTELDILEYKGFIELNSEDEIEDEADEYDFNDGFLINDL